MPVRSNQRGNSELAMIGIICLVIAVVVVGLQLQSLANGLQLDLKTTCWEVVLFAAFCVPVVWSMRKGFFLRLLCYAPLAVFVCLLPALNFWSWEYILPHHDGVVGLLSSGDTLTTMREEPLWYGQNMFQALTVLITSGLGYLSDTWVKQNY